MKNIIMQFQNKKFVGYVFVLFIFLWAYTGIVKLADHNLFIEQLNKQPLPQWSIHIMAWLLPLIELITGSMLLVPQFRRAGLFSSFILMLCFTIYVAVVLSGDFGEIPCACAGIFSGILHWKGHLVFNIIFLILGFFGWRKQKRVDEIHNLNTKLMMKYINE